MMTNQVPKKRGGKARRVLRWLLLALAILALLLAPWIAPRLHSKVRFARVARRAQAALSHYDGVTVELTKRHSEGKEETTRSILAWSGDYLVRHQPGDRYTSVRRGTEHLEYCPSWRLGSRWTEEPSDYPLPTRFESIMRFGIWSASWRYWLNPFLSTTQSQSEDGLVVRATMRWPVGLRNRGTYSVTDVLDPQSFLPKQRTLNVTHRGQESVFEVRVIEYHRDLPDGTFATELPADAVDLGERAEQIIQSDQDQGYRLSLFDCSRDTEGALLLGFTYQRIGKEDIVIDRVSLTDAATGLDITGQYDAHRSHWMAGEADRIELWCFSPKSPAVPAITNVSIHVRAGILESFRSGRMSGFSRVRGAQYSFRDIPVSESPWPVFPECTSPPWWQRF